MIYRLMYDGYIDNKLYNSLKRPVSKNAIKLGYDDKLYKPSNEDKKYFFLDNYDKEN